MLAASAGQRKTCIASIIDTHPVCTAGTSFSLFQVPCKYRCSTPLAERRLLRDLLVQALQLSILILIVLTLALIVSIVLTVVIVLIV